MEFEDKLKLMFNIQKIQSDEWYDKEAFTNDKKYRMDVIKDHVLGLYEQTSQIMNTFDWKKQTLMRSENHQNTKEQCTDILKYTIGILYFLGCDEKECYSEFVKKSDTLRQRWNQQKLEMTENTNAVVIDIDNCIADYHKAFSNYLVHNVGLRIVKENSILYSFHETFGISKQMEEKYHDEFIRAGEMLELKLIPGSREVIERLSKSGFKIVLLTARPSWIYNRLFSDTIEWLKSKKVHYDLLLWDKDKADAIIQNVFPASVMCMIEDRDKHAIEVAHLGIKVLLIDKRYNKSISDSNGIKRVADWLEIESVLKQKFGVKI